MRPIYIAACACLVLAALSLLRSGQPSQTVRLEQLTYEEATPYLEARYTVRDGLIWLCTEDNFSKLPQDPLLERLSRETAAVFDGTGQRLSPLVDLSGYGHQDSPWRSFKSPEVRAIMLPAFEEAKRRVAATLQQEGS